MAIKKMNQAEWDKSRKADKAKAEKTVKAQAKAAVQAKIDALKAEIAPEKTESDASKTGTSTK